MTRPTLAEALAAAQAPDHPLGMRGFAAPDAGVRGFTTADVARRFRVSEDKVRAWIRDGELKAINTSALRCARPRYVITPEALAAFEARRQGASPPKPARRRKSATRDWYPD